MRLTEDEYKTLQSAHGAAAFLRGYLHPLSHNKERRRDLDDLLPKLRALILKLTWADVIPNVYLAKETPKSSEPERNPKPRHHRGGKYNFKTRKQSIVD